MQRRGDAGARDVAARAPQLAHRREHRRGRRRASLGGIAGARVSGRADRGVAATPSAGPQNPVMTDPAPFSKSEMMIVAAARELAGQHVCFVGVGLPNIAVNLAKRTVAPDLELVYEAGVFGARPARLPLSIGDPTIVTGATAVVSMLELFGYYLQRGLVDVGFLGAAQIDRFGNINTTVIGAIRQAEDPAARLRRRVRDRDQRPAGLRDHAPEPAQLRRDASTSGLRPAISAVPSRPSGSDARAAGWAAARPWS